jgi:SAM-dependent methyltransferase
MHYKLSKDVVLKTENAAKPENQRSAYLASLISRLEPVDATLDYGCGKLRYQNSILKTTDTLAVVDSEIQLSREQTLNGRKTSIRSLVSRSNRTAVHNVTEFVSLSGLFDRAFCLNVLSVIPSQTTRLRVVQLIRSKLRPGASCLFVVQYRNSDFTRMKGMPNAKIWRDGILIDSLRGYSFYGLIAPERLAALIKQAGFEIAEQHLHDGSVFVWAKSPQMKTQTIKFEAFEKQDDFRISVCNR